MMRLWLAPSVFACASDDGAILLDVERDAYLGLDAQQARALESQVADWPRANPGNAPLDAEPLLASLLTRGLLQESSAGERPLRSAALPSVTASLHAWPEMNPRDVRVLDVLTFIFSWLRAVRLTRRGHLMEAVKRVRDRRMRYGSTPMDLTKARHALGRYVHVRAFFFAKRGRCLLDSLTLLEFLAHEGIYPHWVIAVQVRPFAAHSWVQEESYVFNGTPGYVGSYSPILIV